MNEELIKLTEPAEMAFTCLTCEIHDVTIPVLETLRLVNNQPRASWAKKQSCLNGLESLSSLTAAADTAIAVYNASLIDSVAGATDLACLFRHRSEVLLSCLKDLHGKLTPTQKSKLAQRGFLDITKIKTVLNSLEHTVAKLQSAALGNEKLLKDIPAAERITRRLPMLDLED